MDLESSRWFFVIEHEFPWNVSCPCAASVRGKLRKNLVVLDDPKHDWFYVVTQILKVRPEAPTISRLGCQTLHLACSSHHWNLFKGDVKPAFLQGGKELESSRNISCDPLPEVRKKLNISDAQILKVEGGCYGLRTAPPLRSHFFHFSFCFFLFCWERVEFGRGVTPPSSPPPKPKLVGILLRSSVKFGND